MSLKYWESMSAREKAEEEKIRVQETIRIPEKGTEIQETVVKDTSGTVSVPAASEKTGKAEKTVRPVKKIPRFPGIILVIFAFIGITAMIIIAFTLAVLVLLLSVAGLCAGGMLIYDGVTNFGAASLIAIELCGAGLGLIALGVLLFALAIRAGYFLLPRIAGLYRKMLSIL